MVLRREDSDETEGWAMNEELSIIQCVAILGLMSMFGFLAWLWLSIPGAERRRREEIARMKLEVKRDKISCDLGGAIPFKNEWKDEYDLIEVPYLENEYGGFVQQPLSICPSFGRFW